MRNIVQTYVYCMKER